MAQHRNYWSCSKFADWIRGTDKLKMGTSEEWNDWNDTAESKHPFRYWISDTVLDNIQDFVTWPVRKLYDVKYYINNRWISKSNACTAHKNDIKPGDWQDVGYRFLPCLFNELVDFVEVELAWCNIVWDKDAAKKFKAPWYAKGWFRFRVWRSIEAGIDHLDWQIALKNDDGTPTPQAEAAMEIKKLYNWWKWDRKERPDIYDSTGWTEYCETERSEHVRNRLPTGQPNEKTKKLLDDINELEAKYEQEDEDMLIRLIKIRQHLWT